MEEDKIPKIRFDPAYSGGLLHMDKNQWPFPTVFDIDGLEERPQEIPIVRDHDQGKKVGQTTSIEYSDGKITAEGRIIYNGIDPDAAKVVELAKRGAKLQASVATHYINGADVEFIGTGETGEANGQTFDGPVEIVRRWRLKEISIVTIGADDDGTRVIIGEASNGIGGFFAPRRRDREMKKKNNWASIFQRIGVKRSTALKAAAKIGAAADATEDDVANAIEQAIEEEKKKESATAKSGKAEETEPEKTGRAADSLDEEEKAALAAFAEDIGVSEPLEEMDEETLEVLKAAWARWGAGAENPIDDEAQAEDDAQKNCACAEDEQNDKPIQGKASSGRLGTPRAGAVSWSRTKYPADRLGTISQKFAGKARPNAARVAEASLMTANGTDGAVLERLGYSKEEIDEASRRENRNLSLLGLMYRTGAASPGMSDVATIGESLNNAQYIARNEKLFPGYRVARAAGQLSTVDIPNVLANVMYKSLLNGLQTVEDPTDRISRVVNARDFREQNFVNLLASGEFADVKANGELENLKLSDANYTNAAKMRGFELRLGYEAIANDDMNALQEIPRIMGRKAALRKQKIFFDVLTSASSLPGVTSNPVLALAGLDKACAAFRGLKDDDNDPIGAAPKFIIVPPALEATALNLVMASEIVAGSTGDATGLTIVPNQKRYAARFEVITSEYLGSGGPFSSNWGDKRWMLLADPADVPLMILSYYQNQREPTLKTVYGDVDIEGLKFKCYWGFGVSTAEKKSCVNSTPS